MAFILSKELKEFQKENLKNGEEIQCYCLSLHHKSRIFYDEMYLTIEQAKEEAKKHAQEEDIKGLKYIIVDVILLNVYGEWYRRERNATIKIEGTKIGKTINWTEIKL